jgi:hypothetical protein
MELNILVGGETLNTHESTECVGDYCTIHNNSDHHMVTWKQTWDFRVGRIMRICKHNVAHADPDEINPNREHHCDGCCDPASQFQIDAEELTKDYKTPEHRSPLSFGVGSSSPAGSTPGVHTFTGEKWISTSGTGGGIHTHSTSLKTSVEELERLISSIGTRRKHKGTDL